MVNFRTLLLSLKDVCDQSLVKDLVVSGLPEHVESVGATGLQRHRIKVGVLVEHRVHYLSHDLLLHILCEDLNQNVLK